MYSPLSIRVLGSSAKYLIFPAFWITGDWPPKPKWPFLKASPLEKHFKSSLSLFLLIIKKVQTEYFFWALRSAIGSIVRKQCNNSSYGSSGHPANSAIRIPFLTSLRSTAHSVNREPDSAIPCLKSPEWLHQWSLNTGITTYANCRHLHFEIEELREGKLHWQLRRSHRR